LADQIQEAPRPLVVGTGMLGALLAAPPIAG